MKYLWTSSSPASQWKKRGEPARVRTPPTLTYRPDPIREWKGFGGCFNELGWTALNRLSRENRQRALESLFSAGKGCGFTYCRLPIGASDYAETWYSHNENPGDFKMKRFSIERDHRHLIPYIRAARELQPELYLFASPWSPPTWLKNPQAYNNGKLIWQPECLKAYALYFLRFVRSYAKEGIPIHAVHVQNEPNSDQKFPSCLWTGEKMRDFIRDYLGPLFRKERLDCEIWAGTIERADVNAWAQLILSDPAARRFITGVGYQWAGKGAVQRTKMAWPDVPVIQTENECGDGANTWDYAHYVFDLMHHYITNGAEAYVYWNMILQANGESTWGWRQNSMISVDAERATFTYNPEYYVMRHFASFVEPGSHVLMPEGILAGNAMAFRKTDGRIVYVVHNPFATPAPVRLGNNGQVAEFIMEPQSINTIVAPPDGSSR
jgi:glucosylceramidase